MYDGLEAEDVLACAGAEEAILVPSGARAAPAARAGAPSEVLAINRPPVLSSRARAIVDGNRALSGRSRPPTRGTSR